LGTERKPAAAVAVAGRIRTGAARTLEIDRFDPCTCTADGEPARIIVDAPSGQTRAAREEIKRAACVVGQHLVELGLQRSGVCHLQQA
jgi:hypothetical protein